jgi:choice-of-anchor C domain-containing protein
MHTDLLKVLFVSVLLAVGTLGCGTLPSEKDVAPAAPSEGRNIVQNGSFELGPQVRVEETLNVGDEIPGWFAVGGPVDLTGSALWRPTDGYQCIDLEERRGRGGIRQILNTTSGSKYRLVFDCAGNPDGPPKMKRLVVIAGDQEAEFNLNIEGKSRWEVGWVSKSLDFKAKSSHTTLEFRSANESGLCYGPLVDNVRVYAIN